MSSVGWMAKMASAYLAAKSRPLDETPAWMLIADREGGGEPDGGGGGAHPGQERDRVVARDLCGVLDHGRHRAGVGVRDEIQVGEEHHVEFAALAHPGDVLVELGARPVVRV